MAGPVLAVTLAGTATAQGGYFPTAWGWLSLAFLWLTAITLLTQRQVTLATAETVLLTAMLAFTGWSAVSLLWSPSTSSTLHEVQRTLIYLAGALAFVLTARRLRPQMITAVAVGAIGVISIYALSTRLFPGRLAHVSSLTDYRLFAPVGYANALGAFLAVGLLLALGLALRAPSRGGRSAAAGLLPILASTQYLTFSRGADIALACGLAAAILVDRRRLQLITGTLILAVPAGLAVWRAALTPALTHPPTDLAQAARQDHRVALTVALMSVVAAALALMLSRHRANWQIRPRTRRICQLALPAGLVAGAAVLFAAVGQPFTLARHAWTSFEAPAPVASNLNQSLLSLSGAGRVDAWRAALHDFAQHPVLGSGAGTYQAYWAVHRPSNIDLRDAHSLYLETLAELGVVGLVLLLTALLTPLFLLRRLRGEPLAGALAGAYVTYLIHAGVDWDWEMPAVTMAGLLAGLLLIALARPPTPPLRLRLVARAGAVVATLLASAFALSGLLAETALSAGARALSAHHWRHAEAAARTASFWEPWSAQPWELIAQAHYDAGDLSGAARYLRLALRRDPGNWQLWSDLGFALDGSAAEKAFARARQLNPQSPQIPTPGR